MKLAEPDKFLPVRGLLKLLRNPPPAINPHGSLTRSRLSVTDLLDKCVGDYAFIDALGVIPAIR